MQTPARVVVLLEGRSDVAAVRVLLRTAGLDGNGRAHDVELVDMGGVTNIRHHLVRLVAGAPGTGATTRVLGLGDVAQAPFLARALAVVGRPVGDLRDMAALGFHVCDRDLEDELLRALGPARVVPCGAAVAEEDQAPHVSVSGMRGQSLQSRWRAENDRAATCWTGPTISP